ncbi:TRAP transporter substrate-binding protein DctP [Paracoccus fistulariae]|uniref:TRAP transporter substrate-binding protein DctP n=1 Tax=Paracoccus fistulariae TaxID=658446 RepID=A0ABY7SLF9_9RHOB|nr:TRAP transporter substrate-binding protein DctP [Paracoccus fistulariae]MDB6182630.1 TRAP transporter substrate-binding protein DctP [Paracoccus fistulariae]WCR07835.1 TRAP transporter substrate-binding protein DctP [Paracoccus fistulariae]
MKPMKMIARTLITGAALAAAVGMASAETMKYSDHDATGGMRTDFVNDVWLPEIEKQTGGEIKVRPFFGGVLLGSKEVLGGVGDNVAQLGFAFPGHYPNQMVAHSVFAMFPTGPVKFENQVWLYHQAYAEIPELKAELEKAGVVPLMITAGLPGAFFGKKPMDGLDGIQGDKWRAGGKWLLRYLESAGAQPVSVPWGDVYVALQTGTIDGVFANYDGMHLMKFDEVAQNILISKKLWYATPFVHFINKDVYEGLSEETRAQLHEASRISEEKFGAVYDAAFDQVRSEQEASGYTINELSDDDIATWSDTDKLTVLQDAWVAEAKEAGLANADEVMAKMRELHAQAMLR